jgi:transcriptional regulator with XRE-family HTH domain
MVSGRKPNLQRRQRMMALRARGLTLTAIGQRLGVSRQAVSEALRTLQKGRSSRSVPCSVCGQPIVSAGALASDSATALCLRCLGQDPRIPFSQRLKAHRLAAGLTKTELSQRAGLNPAAIRLYEAGLQQPRRKSQARLIKVLGPAVLGP